MSSAGCDDGVDLISDLTDDLLLHVLGFLPDARDVVCTSMLSTRWRCLWTRTPVLRIGNWNCYGRRDMDDGQFNDFVHGVLARWCDHDIDRLELHAWLWPGKSRADEWLDRAMRHTVGSLEFDVSTPPVEEMMEDVRDNRPQMDMPAATRVAKMSLGLDHAGLLLPPAVKFHELTELTLCSIGFSDDDGPSLSRLLSSPSCCPTLWKLKLSNLSGLHDLRLDGATLETLHLEHIDVRRLDVDAPSLSVLHAGSFFMRDHISLTVRAPALQKLITSLEVTRLSVQPYTITLLQECHPMHSHTLSLLGPKKLTRRQKRDPMPEMPQLPGVTNLTIHYRLKNNHYLGATVTSLLERCSNLEYLHLDNLVQVQSETRCKEGCRKCNLHGRWKDKVISLEHLRDVKFGGFTGRERCCLDMLQLLLANAPALERIVVTARTSFDLEFLPPLVLAESLESSLPYGGRGRWTVRRATDDAATISEYEWTSNLQMLVPNGARDCAISQV